MNTTSAEQLATASKLNARFTEINLAIVAFQKQKSLWLLGLLPSFGKDSDEEVATEQSTVVVDVTFMPCNNPEIS